MFLRLPRPKDTQNNDAEKPCWMEILQQAFDGLAPTDERLELFLDHYERMP